MNFAEFLKTLPSQFTPLIEGIPQNAYLPIDLSTKNASLSPEVLKDPKLHQQWIQSRLRETDSYREGKRIAYGGYLEKRRLYERSPHFQTQAIENRRNIHLGIDLWYEAGAVVIAPLDGKIHSFKDNKVFGDYGPTLILEHHIENEVFYTLYGHLSRESLQDKQEGTTIKKGEAFATLGTPEVNGSYAPHLHFQLIAALQNHYGDYPGVCSQKDLSFYRKNCPDPNLLLKIQDG